MVQGAMVLFKGVQHGILHKLDVGTQVMGSGNAISTKNDKSMQYQRHQKSCFII